MLSVFIVYRMHKVMRRMVKIEEELPSGEAAAQKLSEK